MSSLISIDDAFVVGVSCDLVGGVFLARGLLAKPVKIAERASTIVGASPPVMAGLIKARADGEFGIAALALGFLLQAGGYLALVGEVRVSSGGIRPSLAVALALIVAGALCLLAAHILPMRIRAHVRAVARVRRPDEPKRTMALIGKSLGFGDVDSEDPKAVDDYVRRHFG
jgi:hypothetical protein